MYFFHFTVYNYSFVFLDSGHTLGNLIQKELLRDPDTKFAGYAVPHPLETRMIVKLMTSGKSPREIMNNAFVRIIDRLDKLKSEVEAVDVTVEAVKDDLTVEQ